MLRRLASALMNIARRKRLENDLDEELQAYLALLEDEHLSHGLTPEEARRQARLSVEGMEQLKERTRDVRAGASLDLLGRDVRFALRNLKQNPGFTVVAILTLALGIGANAAMFSVVNGVLLRPLPYRSPDRLVMVWEKSDNGAKNNLGYATYLDFRNQTRTLEQLAVYSSWQPILQNGEPAPLNGLRVTSNYFRALGVLPELGSDFLPEQDKPGSNLVVMLSHGLWVGQFNSDPGVVGKSIKISGASYLVSGVMPASFESLMNQDPRGGAVEIWRVLGYDVTQPWACRTCHHLIAIGRLRDGVTMAQANAELDTVSAGLIQAYPKEYSNSGVIVSPLREHLLGAASTPLYILLGAVFFVLLVACANLANLLLAHATHREREVALRAALGASRGRIIRQLLVENGMLAAIGAVVGFVPAYAAPRILQAMGSGGLPRQSQIQVDWRVLLFTAVAAVVTAAISGFLPAIRLSKVDLKRSLNEGTRGSPSGARTRHLLVTAEIALSLTLLTGAGLMFQSLWRLLRVAPGFDPAAVLTLQSSAVGPKYADNTLLRRLISTDVANLRAIPGIDMAAATSQIPLGGNVDRYGFHPEGKMNSNPELDQSAERYCVTPSFLATLRIPLIRGRDIVDSDTDAAPGVILINEVTAKHTWPGEDPIGKRVKLGGVDGPWFTVIGIAGDIHHRALDEAPSMQVYVPHAQWPRPDNQMTFVIRTSGAPANFAGPARQALRSADSTQAISRVIPLGGYVSISVEGRRFALILIAAFATIAVLLSAVGIYGVTSYTVAQRTHEIGIRVALGATRTELFALLMKEGFLLLGGGLVAGLLMSFSLMRFLQTLLFEVTPTDPLTMGLVILLLAAIVAIASCVPARRALRVDPIVALRHQ